MVMDVRFVFMLPTGIRMRAVRMIHSRMVVLVPVRGDEVLHLSSRTALAVVREMDVIVIVHQRLVLVTLQSRGHVYDAPSLRLSSHHPCLNSLACSAREAFWPRAGRGGWTSGFSPVTPLRSHCGVHRLASGKTFRPSSEADGTIHARPFPESDGPQPGAVRPKRHGR